MAYTQRGSGFVGLRDYLGLNRQQGEAMGNTLASQVEQEAAAARGAVDAAGATLKRKAEAAVPTYQSMPVGLDSAEEEAFRQARAGVGYTGPRELGDVANVNELQTGLDKARQTGSLAATDAGRSVLLSQRGQGARTQGGRMLDASLAGRGGGERLEAATRGTDALRNYLGLAQTAAQGVTADAAARGAAVQDRYRKESEDLRRIRNQPIHYNPVAPKAPPVYQAPPRPEGNQVGNIFVPANPEGRDQIIGTTPIPAAPQPAPAGKKPNKGGQYIGGVWVPYE